MQIRAYRPSDEAAVIALWQACGLTRPWNDPHRDIARKRVVQPELFLIADLAGTVVGSAMAGFDGHRGWVNYLAVSPEHRRKSIGRSLMAEAERLLERQGCPKLNVQIRLSNAETAAFYQRLGYVQDPVLSFGRRLIVDDATLIDPAASRGEFQ